MPDKAQRVLKGSDRSKAGIHMVAQHQFLGLRIEIHPLFHPVGHRMSVQVVLEPLRSYFSGTSPCR
jgi:hypothetical protein